MYIETVPNRQSPPCILLRESYREGSKVRKRTLANLTSWPQQLVEGLRTLLRGGVAVEDLSQSFETIRSQPHGQVAAVVGTIRRLNLDEMVDSRPSRQRELVLAMVTARILDPRSKLATARGLGEENQFSSLVELLGLGSVGEEDLYQAMDWLLERQARIEDRLAQRHLEEGSLVLYDVTSTYFEGQHCPLARHGYSRDGKNNKLQIVFGLLTNRQGCPVAVEVFAGDLGDPSTLKSQIEKLRGRFRLRRVILVGDRGLITEARIREELAGVEGLEWITALRAPQIRQLAQEGLLQPSLFDERDLAEISSPDFPEERLIVCRNPLLGEERARKREELLTATEEELEKIARATERPKRRLKGKEKIALRVGRVIDHYKMAKHFELEIADEHFSYRRREEQIRQEAALDGIYVIRTCVPAPEMNQEEVVRAYKDLSRVEQAFRSYKTIDLKVRPIYHRLAERVRAHVFLCMLAYYVQWHLRRSWAPLLFGEDDPREAQQLRSSIVAPAQRSARAKRKAQRKRTDDGLPVHSFRTLLADLTTIVKNRIQPKFAGAPAFDQITRPTPLQQRALDLIGVRL